MLRQGGNAALERQQIHSDSPTFTGFTHNHGCIGNGIGEKDFVEFAAAGDLHDGTGFNAGLIHRHQQERQTFMTLRAGLGASNDKAPMGNMRQRRPDFLSVNDPLVSIENGACLHIGEIRTGIRFGIALTPTLFTAQNWRKKTVALLFCAVRNQCRAQQVFTHVIDTTGRLGPRVFLGPNDLLCNRGVTAAELTGPTKTDPTRFT